MKKKIYWLLGFIILINGAILLSNSTYLYKAIFYNFPNQDDYKIFSNKQLEASNTPYPWHFSDCIENCHIPDQLSLALHESETDALLFIKGDSIYLEKYWNGYNNQSISNSFSIAKSWVSALIGIAIKEGKIQSVNQPVSDFLPHFKKEGNKNLSIKNLLTMSSGLNWNESYANPFSITTKAYYGSNLNELVDQLEVIEQPGVNFKYLSGNTQVLGQVLEKATGKGISAYASEKLWNPIGSTHNALWSLDKENGQEKAFCCLNATARDFARLGKLYRDHGNWNGKQLIDKKFIDQSVQGHQLIDDKGNLVDYYGYHWWIIPDYKGLKVFYCQGLKGQYTIVIPKLDVVIVRLGKEQGKKEDVHFKLTYALLDGAIEFFNHPDNAYYY